MTSDNGLSLILRRLDEIERKLDHMLRTADPQRAPRHRLFGAPGQFSKEGLKKEISPRVRCAG